MRTEMHPTAYKQRIVPTIHGEVVQVSADRLTDGRTNSSYFVASIRPDMAELPGVRLRPGMPATAMIPTESRTAFDCLVGPLAIFFKHAFRQS
jgi:membrane fusion protein, epimerase transport system